jgi:putative endonuclease
VSSSAGNKGEEKKCHDDIFFPRLLRARRMPWRGRLPSFLSPLRSLLAALAVQYAAWRQRIAPPRTLGQQGEDLAARYLRGLGYKIVARSDRAVLGELDLVAVDGRTIVFVEVKTRASHEAGHPADAVDLVKQAKLTRLALTYMRRHDLLECASRFDVIAISWGAAGVPPTIEHFKNAFEARGAEGLFG